MKTDECDDFHGRIEVVNDGNRDVNKELLPQGSEEEDALVDENYRHEKLKRIF